MKLALVTACALALVPLAARADDGQARTVLIAAFEANDCKMRLSDARRAFEEAGLDSSLASPTALKMVNAGEIKFGPKGKQAILQIGACEGTEVESAQVDPELRAAIVALYEANDCVIDPRGKKFKAFRDVYTDGLEAAMVALANEGAITLAKNESVLKVGEVCAAKAQ